MSVTLTSAAVATPAAMGGSWAVHISQCGRVDAVLLTALASAIPVNSGRPLFRNAYGQKIETIAESGRFLARGAALRVVLRYF